MGDAENNGPEPSRAGFQKGQSGNPGGRPKHFAIFRELLSKTRKERFDRLNKLIKSSDERIALEAIKHADAYDYGKPVQSVEHSGADGGPLQILIKDLSKEPNHAQ